MNLAALATEVRKRAVALRAADEKPLTVGELADDGELLLVLARIIEGRALHSAFGSPGDWGYQHPIGAAIRAAAEKGGVQC